MIGVVGLLDLAGLTDHVLVWRTLDEPG